MSIKDYYTVGEAADVFGISKKTLRFYHESGLLKPDKICEKNYRYYTLHTLLQLVVIKYYKSMGMSLSEIREATLHNSLDQMIELFKQKKTALEEERQLWLIQHTSLSDWLDLLEEARAVREHRLTDVSVRFVNSTAYHSMAQDFIGCPMSHIINIEWNQHIEQSRNAITGPVIIQYPDPLSRMNATAKHMRILQKTVLPTESTQTLHLGGAFMLSCYHIGDHSTLPQTYQKMLDWASERGHNCQGPCYERYVVDFWTTSLSEHFVTEVLLVLEGSQRK